MVAYLLEKEIFEVKGEYQILIVGTRCKEIARSLGFSLKEQTEIAISASEIASNIVYHAKGGGMVVVEIISEEGRRGIEIRGEDKGPGIENIELALQDGYSTIGSIGGGLPALRRLMDFFQIESELGKGTKVVVRKWLKK